MRFAAAIQIDSELPQQRHHGAILPCDFQDLRGITHARAKTIFETSLHIPPSGVPITAGSGYMFWSVIGLRGNASTIITHRASIVSTPVT